MKRFFDWVGGILGDLFLLLCLFAIGAAIGWVASNFGIGLGAAILGGLRADMWLYDSEFHKVALALAGSLVGGTVAVLPAFRILGHGGGENRRGR